MTAGAVAREHRARFASPPLELWGGIECSLVRVGDDFRNQVEETGHRARLSDIDAMASLGIKAVRYPILWESIAPEDPDALDFSWHDERLNRLREQGIRVIAGLLHHGSGPRFTELLDPNFPSLFANYARRVAERRNVLHECGAASQCNLARRWPLGPHGRLHERQSG